jgi:hypothetical protein
MLSLLADNATSPPSPPPPAHGGDYSTMMNERDDHSDDGLEDGDGLSYISDELQC